MKFNFRVFIIFLWMIIVFSFIHAEKSSLSVTNDVYLNFDATPKPISVAWKSAILPGYGELTVGNKTGYFFLAAEIALWGTYLYEKDKATLLLRQSQQHAFQNGNVKNGSYNNNIWKLMSKYTSSGFESGGYNASIVQIAYELYPSQPELQTAYIKANILDDSIYWKWNSDQDRGRFKDLRSKSMKSDEYALVLSGIIILNHGISFINALRVANQNNQQDLQIYSRFDEEFNPFICFSFDF